MTTRNSFLELFAAADGGRQRRCLERQDEPFAAFTPALAVLLLDNAVSQNPTQGSTQVVQQAHGAS